MRTGVTESEYARICDASSQEETEGTLWHRAL